MYRDINNENDHYYVFVGRTQPWDDENNPPAVIDNRVTESETRRNIMFAKRVAPTDIVYLVRNIPWIENTIYDRYDDIISPTSPAPSGATSIQTANFYVLTDDFNVYKCINNNKASPSRERPTGTSTEIFTTADGYVWKFMYQVPVLDRTKFLSPQWLPARHYTGGYHFDVNGFLSSVDVITGGTGYTQNNTHVLIDGDGKGAVAVPVVTSGAVTEIDIFQDSDAILHTGDGYSFIFASVIGDGSGATARANLGKTTSMPVNDVVPEAAIPGGIHVIDVLTSGQDYFQDNTSVTIEGDGEGAEAVAIVDNGAVVGIEITNAGVNYDWITVTINSPVGFGATARAIVSPRGGHGFDSPDELFATAFSIMVEMGVDGDSPDIFTGNDYRQLGLLKNPLVYDSTQALVNVTASACHVIEAEDTSVYHPDDMVSSDDGGLFRVIQVIDPNVWLQPVKDYISGASTLTNVTTAIDNLTINNGTIVTPEIDVYSGEVLYVNNKIRVARLTEQTETLQIFFSF
jgi:hypothetical protein